LDIPFLKVDLAPPFLKVDFFKGGYIYIYMNQYIFLFLILVLALSIPIIFNVKNPLQMLEGFSNYNLETSPGIFPIAQTKVLVQDTYPPIGKNELSNDTAADIWRKYPVFPLGSYDQITNNIRYPSNPDEGTCMPASMCGALYHDKNMGSNYVEPLPPVNPNCGNRIGYFDTYINLLPFRNDMVNILY
jgi:hypothetical protein